MRTLVSVGLGVILTAALCSSGPVPVFADDISTNPANAAAIPGRCEPGPIYVPGTSLGPVAIGAPLAAVQRQLGRPRSIDNRSIQGHQWTRMHYAGLDVLGRDNSVAAVNLPQVRPVLVRTRCGTLVSRPLSLPLNFVQQSYGPPSANFVLNGLQYWVYNTLGLLFTAVPGAPYVQSLMVFPAGGYCGITPVWVSFGTLAVQTLSVSPCRSAGDHER